MRVVRIIGELAEALVALWLIVLGLLYLGQGHFDAATACGVLCIAITLPRKSEEADPHDPR